ncbi:gag-pol polyprotein [Tanacetum coccineum]
MDNNIMATGSRDRLPMLATGRYAQCQSRFLRYIDTRPNGDALRKCILEEKEAIHLLLTRIGDEIYSTVDACKTAHDMFVTIVKQQHKLDEVSYHKLFDILKQYQKEVNEIRAERIAKNANPLALVAAAQSYLDPYYQASKSHKSYAPTSKASPLTRSHATTRHKGKRTVNVAGARETVGSQVVQQTGIQCFNCKEYGHFAKECRKPKRVKDFTYYKEKMLLCKQAEKADSGTDTEPLKQVKYDARYDVFANERQHSGQPESISNTCVVEKVDSNVIPDSLDMCDNDIQTNQNVVKCDDERVALANLIANLKLDVDENKNIQKQLKKANTTLAHELTGCKSILAETSKTLGESNSIRDSCLIALQNK